jgi:hypothetical protein
MAEVRFKPRIDGFREIRYSSEAQRMLEAVAHTVADTANGSLVQNGPRDVQPGYAIRSRPGKRVKQGRWRVSVTAVTQHAIRHNAIHNTLLRALGGAR